MSLRQFVYLSLLVLLEQQLFSQTLVFTVRAPATQCSIITDESYLRLELDNPVRVKVKGPNNIKTFVAVTGGKIISVKDDIYYMRFTKPGTAAISVYKEGKYGRELLTTKKMDVKGPELYFCNIKLDSVSKYIRLKGNGAGMHAYSNYYKKDMSITSFEMFYTEDTTRRGAEPARMKSDSCMITQQMKNAIMNFQPKYSSIYMLNIICKVPDGTKRILDPVQLRVDVDTANKEKLSLIYSVSRKVL
ncbi:MAG: hypothetical protein WAQ28_06575 [Bacteroidia bacterium]